jgi:hypothetical protein
MGNEKEGLSTAESSAQDSYLRPGECHNPSCMGRLEPKSGDKIVKCPKCGMEYRVAWVKMVSPHQRSGMGCKQRLAERR